MIHTFPWRPPPVTLLFEVALISKMKTLLTKESGRLTKRREGGEWRWRERLLVCGAINDAIVGPWSPFDPRRAHSFLKYDSPGYDNQKDMALPLIHFFRTKLRSRALSMGKHPTRKLLFDTPWGACECGCIVPRAR